MFEKLEGNNFVLSHRFAKYYKNNENIETRTLIKAYGIRFDVIVFGMVCLLVQNNNQHLLIKFSLFNL